MRQGCVWRTVMSRRCSRSGQPLRIGTTSISHTVRDGWDVVWMQSTVMSVTAEVAFGIQFLAIRSLSSLLPRAG